MNPKHSIAFCPICGGGLCGVRICGVGPTDPDRRITETGSDATHGLIVCDECEAIWLQPDLSTAHQYADAEDARCPVCGDRLWGSNSHWADSEELTSLGWEFAIDPRLDADLDEDNPLK